MDNKLFQLTPISDPPKEDGRYFVVNDLDVKDLMTWEKGQWVDFDFENDAWYVADPPTHYLAPLAEPVEGVFSETMLNHVWVGARIRMNGSCQDAALTYSTSIYRYSFEEWLRYAKYAYPDLFKYNHDEYVPKFEDWADEEGWEECTNGVWVRNSCLGDKDFSEESSRDDLFRMYLKDLPRLIHPEKESSTRSPREGELEREVEELKQLMEKKLRRAYTRGWVAKHQQQTRGKQESTEDEEIKAIMEWDGIDKPSPFQKR